MQIRLMLVVALLLGAVSFCEAALSGRFPFAAAKDVSTEPPKVETRLPASPPRTEEDLTRLTVALPDSPWTQDEAPSDAQKPSEADEVANDFWNRLYHSLTVSQQDHVMVLLRFALRNASAPLGTSDRASLMRKLEESSTAYEASAAEELSKAPGMTPQRREAFSAALQRVMTDWRERFGPLLSRLCLDEPIPAGDRPLLREILARWTDLARREVRDDASTPAKDFVYWFSLIDELRYNPEALANAATPSYADLFDQSAHWRGKAVALSGQIELAVREPARNNHYGVDGYYVLWIRPDNYSDAPLRVFVLRPPLDSGAASDAPLSAAALEKLVGRSVQLQGLYFKRMAYRAQDNIRAVPTILADQVELLAAPESPRTMANQLSLITLSLLAAALVAVGAAIFLFTSGDRRKPRLPDKIELPPTPQEQSQ